MSRIIPILVLGGLAIGILKIATVDQTLGLILAGLTVFGLVVWHNQG